MEHASPHAASSNTRSIHVLAGCLLGWALGVWSSAVRLVLDYEGACQHCAFKASVSIGVDRVPLIAGPLRKSAAFTVSCCCAMHVCAGQLRALLQMIRAEQLGSVENRLCPLR